MCSNINYLKVLSIFGACVSTMVTPVTQKISLADVTRFGGYLTVALIYLYFFTFSLSLLLSVRDVSFRETYRTNKLL